MSLANFNITFGKEYDPLLEHFEDIFIPALTSGNVRTKSNDRYLFMNVKVFEISEGEFILSGYFVKDTIVEIRSKHTEKGLVYTNEMYPSAPFSIFVVFLKNHRALLVKNQKESPDVRSLNATINHILKKYIKDINENREPREKLPYAQVNIVNLPSKNALIDNLEQVKKVKELVLRFYPLNNDIPVDDILDGIGNEIKGVGGSGGRLIVNSPSKKEEIVKLLTETQGMVEPSLTVEYINGGTGRLKNEDFSLAMEVDIPEEVTFKKQIEAIVSYKDSVPEINEVSQENLSWYQKSLDMLKRLKTQFE